MTLEAISFRRRLQHGYFMQARGKFRHSSHNSSHARRIGVVSRHDQHETRLLHGAKRTERFSGDFHDARTRDQSTHASRLQEPSCKQRHQGHFMRALQQQGAISREKEALRELFIAYQPSSASPAFLRNCQCGYDLEKALDSLLDISKLSNNQFKERIGIDHIEVASREHRKCGVINSEIHCEMLSKDPSRNEQSSFQLADKPSVPTYLPSAKEQDILHFVGSGCREYLKVPLNAKEQVPSRSGMVNTDLQQKVLESLFNVPEMSCVVNNMNWKKIVKQVESFGQGLEFGFEWAAEPSSESKAGGKEDDYHAFRNVAKKNWDTMRSYYHKATLAYSRGERAQAFYLSEKGTFYKKLAHEADEKASREIFEARNKSIKNTVTIDLHGQHVKQAIRLLKLHLLLFAYIPSVHFLRVITGCGADGVGLGKLKRMVLDLARKEGIKCNQENSGTLLLCLEAQRSYTFMESEVDSDENIP